MKKLIVFLGLLLFGIQSNAQQLLGGEYFIDTAPAQGGGTSFSFPAVDTANQVINVPVSSLSSGFHNLFIRVKNTTGIWSHYEGRLFYVISSIVIPSEPAIAQAEWFVDTDPGFGNGTAINFTAGDTVNQVINVPVASLSTGFHNLFVRAKNTQGVWSHHEGRLFYVIPSLTVPAEPALQSGEWFVDTDPGFGSGNALTFVQSDTVNQVIDVGVANLTAGFHNLFIRTKNANGIWSHHEGRLFYVIPSYVVPAEPQIAYAEWFVDTDPGFGNGNQLTYPATDTVNTLVDLSTTELSLGIHQLFLRVKNEDGIWSHYEGRSFSVQNCDFTVSISANSATSCQGTANPVAAAGGGSTFQWYINDVLQPGTNSTIDATESGNYYVVATDNQGCSAASNTISITVNPTPTVDITASEQTICSGTTIDLTAEGADSYTWSAGAASTGINTASATPSITTTYTVTGYIGVCSSTATTSITVNQTPTANTTTSSPVITASFPGASYQWLDCDDEMAPIPNAIGQSFTAPSNGSYAVAVTMNGCEAISSCVVLTDVGVNENVVDAFTLDIYPNPTNGRFMIESASAKIKAVSVYNIIGELVFQTEMPRAINRITLNASEFSGVNAMLSSGAVYFVHVTDEHGYVVNRKMVIQ